MEKILIDKTQIKYVGATQSKIQLYIKVKIKKRLTVKAEIIGG